MAFATMNASPPRTCRMQNAPPGKEKHSRMQNAPPGKEKHSRMRNAPPGKGKPHAKCSPWKGKTACEMLPPGKGFTSN